MYTKLAPLGRCYHKLINNDLKVRLHGRQGSRQDSPKKKASSTYSFATIYAGDNHLTLAKTAGTNADYPPDVTAWFMLCISDQGKARHYGTATTRIVLNGPIACASITFP